MALKSSKLARHETTIESTDSSRELPKPLDLAQLCIYGLSILSMGIFLFLPFFNLLHPSPWQQQMGTIHGFASILATVVTVYTGHLAFPLLRGSSKILSQVRTLAFWSTLLAFGGIVTGNWVYMRYSADAKFGGAKALLKENSPLVPYILSSYHRFSSLFILPLGVACTWILWRYGDAILEKQHRGLQSAICIALMGIMFFSMSGFVTGLAISKIQPL
jgi:hypothetical protein